MLTERCFEASYGSDTHDIGAELYLPCLGEAVAYDRISGFFSSAAYALAWPALRSFVARGGRIRLLCSPRLSEADADGIVAGYEARSHWELAAAFQAELEAMLNRYALRDTARLLAALIARDILDVRLASLAAEASVSSKRMFHDKVGIFTDEAGNRVGFRGTFNESYLGIARDGNLESVDVWTSWEGGKDVNRLSEAVERFDRLWDGRAEGVRVLELPDDTVEFVHQVAAGADLAEMLGALEGPASSSESAGHSWVVGGKSLHEHQKAAFKEWRAQGNRGLLEHATGSGKTLTGLVCVRQAVAEGLTPIIIVPATLLQEQWCAHLRDVLGMRVVTYGGDAGRREPGLLRAVFEDEQPRAIVAVAHSAASTDFLGVTKRFADAVFLLADEVHRLGSPVFRKILDELPARARLGLSATPERAGDEEGTRAVFDYFGGVIHRYTLKDALDDGILTPYVYIPVFVRLCDDEQERFDALTKRINRLSAIARRPNAPGNAQERLAMELIARARILKNAAGKPPAAAKLVTSHLRPEQRWLVYCDNQQQVGEVRRRLAEQNVESWEYYRGMTGDPANTLKAFDLNGGVVVSIRCLDEGVDIPAADHALILASSRNPREHIQRRGRVLRRARLKTVATVLDTVTLPRTIDREDITLPVVVGEMARAVQFADWSLTRDAHAKLRDQWVALGLSLEDLPNAQRAGIETDVTTTQVDVE